MRINSIKFKISILYTTILGIILVVYSSILYFSLQWTLYDDLDEELRLKAKAISDTISTYVDILGGDKKAFLFAVTKVINREGEHPEEYKIIEAEQQWLQKADKLDIESDYIDLLNPRGEVLASAGDLHKAHFLFLSKRIKNFSDDESIMDTKFENRNLRVINRAFSYGGERYIIQVASSLKPLIEILHKRLMLIIITIPLILILASFIGRFFAIKILEPVREITVTAKDITHEDLSARVKIKHVDDEMKYLVNTFNEMIERLEKSFQHISDFSSHVAHELRTPLAIIRGESELVLRKERTPEEYKHIIQENLNEVNRMFRLIEDLLLLSKLEYRPEVFKFEKFEIEQFLKEIYEQGKLLSSQKNISVSLRLSERCTIIKGDKVHLRRLFFNLVHNAVKFTPEGGKIDMATNYKDKKVFVSISDTGIGISKENTPKIFDKFFHAKTDSLNAESGTGLGLSISLAIARVHHGDIRVKSKPGKGSTFTVTLPLV